MRVLFDALRALVYATGFVWLWSWVALGVRRYDRSLGIALPAWTAEPGIAFMAVGGIIALLCVGTFVVRGRGTPAPFDAPRQFVAVGPYRYVRNPMYIGGLLVIVGFGLYLSSPSILIFSLAWVFVAHLFVVFYEEPNLTEKFGAAYEDYWSRVPRWIPRIVFLRRK